MPQYECSHGEYFLSTDKKKLDFAVIHHFLSREAYWSAHIPLKTVKKSIAHSLCYGMYLKERQIGFCRVITDMAVFAYLADVFILEPFRGKGLATWMVQCVMEHPDMQGLRRWLLSTRDAHNIYRKAGFMPLTHPENWMQIHHPGMYRPDPEILS
jgi:GNAT superfamily N-acetyltransferase